MNFQAKERFREIGMLLPCQRNRNGRSGTGNVGTGNGKQSKGCEKLLMKVSHREEYYSFQRGNLELLSYINKRIV